MRTLLLLLVGAAASSCTPEGDAGDGDQCEFDTDCGAAHLICDGGTCQQFCPDVVGPACGGDGDCIGGDTCVAGRCSFAECLPACGNEGGIGQRCTPGGGECNFWLDVLGNFTVCTRDFAPDAELSMCTKPCVDDSDCGAGAVCIGDPDDPGSDTGCVPVACASE